MIIMYVQITARQLYAPRVHTRRDGRVVQSVGCVTGGLQVQRPSAAQVFTLQYWAKLYALTHA